ncbi:MAG TPA: thiamine pyrophosphate-dependent enzyme [Candidatus Baltobacteraceae bacterium]|jgi:acetolactate synthase-1/2/3 large subunit
MRPVFSVSGNQILSLYEGLASADVRIVHTRHESAAAYAAAGWSEATGEIGVALVAGGPGFLASLTGVAVTATMELPVLLLSGGPPSTSDRPGAFQYLDQATIASKVCKGTHKLARVDTIEEDLVRAAVEAQSGIPGPVHVMIPADIAARGANRIGTTLASLPGAPNAASLEDGDVQLLAKIADRLANARRPVVIVRPSAARGRAGAALHELASRLGIRPVIMESPRGTEDLKYRFETRGYASADFALVIGPADFAVHSLSQEALASNGAVALIDAEDDPQHDRKPDVHLRLEPTRALEAIVARLPEKRRARPVEDRASDNAPPSGGALHPLYVGAILRETLGSDDLVILDGGEFCQWVRLALAAVPNQVVWNSRLGAIGGALPLALGAAVGQPQRRIVALVGDGAFGYHLAEIETAVREGVKLTVVVGNDDRWGAEWHTQREKYGRAVATMLGAVRYDEVARGFGARGFDVSSESELRSALGKAREMEHVVCLNTRIASVRSPATAP